jgi:ElaB/YqjD/DUF883 family membrane-anchored ribosome-binding protein
MPHTELTTDEAMARLRADLRTLIHDTEELLKATAQQTGEQAERLRARMKDAVESAKVCCHNLEERAVAAAKSTDHVIRTHPYQSLGVAFGVGVLLGVLLRRN